MKRFLLVISIYALTPSAQPVPTEYQAQSKAYSSSQSFVNKYVTQPLYTAYNKNNAGFSKPSVPNTYWTTSTTTTPASAISSLSVSSTPKSVITYLVTSSRPVTFVEPELKRNATTINKAEIAQPQFIKLDDEEEEEEGAEYSEDHEERDRDDEEYEEEEENSNEVSSSTDDVMKNAAKNPLNFLNLLGTDFQPGRLVNIFFGLIVMLFMMIVQGYAMWVFGIAFLPGTRSLDSGWELDTDRLATVLGYVIEALEYWDQRS